MIILSRVKRQSPSVEGPSVGRSRGLLDVRTLQWSALSVRLRPKRNHLLPFMLTPFGDKYFRPATANRMTQPIALYGTMECAARAKFIVPNQTVAEPSLSSAHWPFRLCCASETVSAYIQHNLKYMH